MGGCLDTDGPHTAWEDFGLGAGGARGGSYESSDT
jgi:hypothetical protein